MPQKKHEPEEVVAKLRHVDMLVSQERPVAEPAAARHRNCAARASSAGQILTTAFEEEVNVRL